MNKTLYKYEASSNKFVWFTTWDRALRNYYTDDYNYVPDPVVGNPYNTFVEFRSRKPGMANVDWGDGIKEQFPMTKVQGVDNYRIIFRSLAIQHKKNPNTTWWFRKEDGSQYVPVDNHAYADGRRDVQRAVSIDFTCDIYYANIQVCKMTSFPIVDIPGLEFLVVSHTLHINDDIPVDKLSRSKKLIYIDLQNMGRKTPTGEQKEDEKSFKSSMDRAWISLPGTWYDRNCTSYPANRSVLYGNTVLLCKEF